MSWHPQHGNRAYGPSGPYGVDAENGAYQGGGDAEGGHGTHETDHVVYGTEHQHTYRYDGYAYGADDDRDIGYDDGSVFVDLSGRRSRLIRHAALAVAAVCVVFMAVVFAGFFSSVPSGGPLPRGQEQEHKQDDLTTATGHPGSTAGPTADPSATPGESSRESAAATSPSVNVSKTGGENKKPTAEASMTAVAPATSAPGRGNSGNHPGRGQGLTKGPR